MALHGMFVNSKQQKQIPPSHLLSLHITHSQLKMTRVGADYSESQTSAGRCLQMEKVSYSSHLVQSSVFVS